jgi:hypothetical protein
VRRGDVVATLGLRVVATWWSNGDAWVHCNWGQLDKKKAKVKKKKRKESEVTHLGISIPMDVILVVVGSVREWRGGSGVPAWC